MNICKADAIAQLSKWYNAGTTVRAIYRSVTGNTSILGRMSKSPSTIRIRGNQCEMVLYLRDTSDYEYNDSRAPVREGQMEQANKYRMFIKVKFSNGDHLEVSFTKRAAVRAVRVPGVALIVRHTPFSS
jgi:hypothetical protein